CLFETSAADTGIVYFGYTRCSDSCPVTLTLLANYFAYSGKTKDQMEMAFVNLDDLGDDWTTRAYAEHYNENFFGYFPKKNELLNLKNQFGLKYEKDSNTGVISHSGRVYFLKKENESWYIVNGLNEIALSPQRLESVVESLLE
ncbi:MAG: hypothetical protein GY786_12760, partial [Proteobacteria bacterium]|nr:hypothetical protein [Pseudomonadota bacterium]